MSPFEVYRKVKGQYEAVGLKAEEYLKAPPQQGVEFVFAEWSLFQNAPHLQNILTSDWAYPAILWDASCHEANGFVGATRHLHKDNSTIVTTSWFQFFIKQLKGDATAQQQSYDYDWYEMSFYVHVLSTGAAVAFCIETPDIFQQRFIATMNGAKDEPSGDPLAFLQRAIVREVSKLYDRSVWTLRDHIRALEKKRSRANFADSVMGFAQLHDLARHTIHTCEVIAVAVDTVSEILDGYDPKSGKPCTSCRGTQGGTYQPFCSHSEMKLWQGLLQNYGRRAKSLDERLSNEINLGFNVVVQQDSRETVRISKMTVDISSAARSDSASMKTIAVVTLAFLPATFVCTIFGMTFFTLNVAGETGKKDWVMSEWFWVYWVITIPLTILTLVCWWFGQRKEQKNNDLRRQSWKYGPP